MVLLAECCIVVIQPYFLKESLVRNTYRRSPLFLCSTCFIDHL